MAPLSVIFVSDVRFMAHLGWLKCHRIDMALRWVYRYRHETAKCKLAVWSCTGWQSCVWALFYLESYGGAVTCCLLVMLSSRPQLPLFDNAYSSYVHVLLQSDWRTNAKFGPVTYKLNISATMSTAGLRIRFHNCFRFQEPEASSRKQLALPFKP